MIGSEKKAYYWTMTSCSGCGQVEIMELIQLILVQVIYLLRYNTTMKVSICKIRIDMIQNIKNV